jgi:hypothetical protein
VVLLSGISRQCLHLADNIITCGRGLDHDVNNVCHNEGVPICMIEGVSYWTCIQVCIKHVLNCRIRLIWDIVWISLSVSIQHQYLSLGRSSSFNHAPERGNHTIGNKTITYYILRICVHVPSSDWPSLA